MGKSIDPQVLSLTRADEARFLAKLSFLLWKDFLPSYAKLLSKIIARITPTRGYRASSTTLKLPFLRIDAAHSLKILSPFQQVTKSVFNRFQLR